MDGDRRVTFAGGVFLLVVALLLLTRCGGGGSTDKVGAVPNAQGPAQSAPITPTPVPATRGSGGDDRGGAAPAEPEADPGPTDDEPAPPPPAAGPTGAGSLTVDGEPLFPLDETAGPDGSLSRFEGGRAQGRRVPVVEVVADEGFWVGSDIGDAVWVQIVGPPPESPYTVLRGDTVSFTGRVVPNGPGFAAEVGVTPAEGAGTLTDQRQHIRVDKRSLSLYHVP